MKTFTCWSLQTWNGADDHNHRYYVSSEAVAKDWLRGNTYDRIEERTFVIYDTLDEVKDQTQNEIAVRAMAKLTDEEKIVLGLK